MALIKQCPSPSLGQARGVLRLSFVAAEDLTPSEWDALHAQHISHISPLYLSYISPISPLYLP